MAMVLWRSAGRGSPTPIIFRGEPPFLTELKLSGSYPLVWGLQVSATIQSIPGTQIVATSVVPSSQIAPSLGRDLAAGAAGAATGQLVEPGSMYGGRSDQGEFPGTETVRLNPPN